MAYYHDKYILFKCSHGISHKFITYDPGHPRPPSGIPKAQGTARPIADQMLPEALPTDRFLAGDTAWKPPFFTTLLWNLCIYKYTINSV